MIKDNKLNYTLELIILLSIYIILAPIFQAIISPFIKIFIDNSLSVNLILIELAKFSIINILLLKVENEKIKKLLIFLSMFTYTLGYNLLMFLMTIAFQNIKKFNYINIVYTYFIILIGIIMYKFRMIPISDFFNGEYDIRKILVYIFIIFIFSINIISFIKYKNIILESNIIKTVFNICMISIIIYLALYHLEFVYFGDKNFDTRTQMIICSSVALINMYIFYYFNISVYEKRITQMISILFVYYLFYFIFIIFIPYKVMALLILIYDIVLVYSGYRKIKLDKIGRIFNSFIVGLFVFFVTYLNSFFNTSPIDYLIGELNYTQIIISCIVGIINIFIAYYFDLNIYKKRLNTIIVYLFIYSFITTFFGLSYSYAIILIGIIIIYDIIVVYTGIKKIKLYKIEKLFDLFTFGILIFLETRIFIETGRYYNKPINIYIIYQLLIPFVIAFINIYIAHYFNLNMNKKRISIAMVVLFIYFLYSKFKHLYYPYIIIGIILIYDIILVIIEYRNKKRNRSIDNNEKN